MPLAPEEWRLRRARFSHDWLKNVYLNRLSALASRLEGTSPDRERVGRAIREDIPQWLQHDQEAVWLASNLERAMSPRELFSICPLAGMDISTIAWLPDVVHVLWMERANVSASVCALREAISAVDETHEAVLLISSGLDESAHEAHHELHRVLVQHIGACTKLVEALRATRRGYFET